MNAPRTLSYLACIAILSACTAEPDTLDADTDEAAADGSVQGSSDTSVSLPPDASSTGPDTFIPGAQCPSGHVTLTMTVDDSANRTYEEGDLLWTGSFAHDASTNTVVYATAWQPTDGPYPPLYDDGPVSLGGHEAEGNVAGDHIFSVAVCYAPEQDRLLSYGVLNSDLRWIWQGPNGLLNVPADAEGQLDAEGLVIPEHGDRDIEITLDLAELHPDYASISLDTHAVFLKGSMNAWTPIQLLDNGSLGDEVAGDGRLTYRHSAYAHGHIGLLRPGQQAQFVFVFALGELDPDLAAEYKVEGEAAVEGTSARMQCLDGWIEAEIIQSLDSKGVTLNTALEVCPEDPDEPLEQSASDECDDQTPCPIGLDCQDGLCLNATAEDCGEEQPCPTGESCVEGECVFDEVDPCDGQECAEGQSCVDGACVPVVEGDCGPGVPCPDPNAVCIDGTCSVPTSSPELVLVVPSTGSELGGTTVSLQGDGLEEGAVVTFGDSAAETVSFSPSELVVKTPAHPVGAADVTVTNPDGAFSTYPKGFTFVTADSAPTITSITPTSGPSSGGTQVTVWGSNFTPGAIVRFGTATATDTVVAPDGTSLTTVSPEAPLGVVTLSVVNPDGQEVSLVDAYTYSSNAPDWGTLHPPMTLTALAEVETITLSAEVYEAMVTEGQGAGFGLMAEAGYGPLGTLPDGENGWSWFPASFSSDVDNNDVWTGGFTAPEGSWAATMRFSVGASDTWLVVDGDGTDNGTSSDQFTTLVVTPAPPVAITSVTPSTSWPMGGKTITLDGVGLSEDCTLSVDDTQWASAWESSTLQFVAPAHVQGEAVLTVSCPDGTADAVLMYAESFEGDLTEWPESSLLAVNTVESSWGEDNVLHSLHVASDATHLYVGVEGQCHAADGFNAIVVYIDTDLGEGTGVTQTSELTDSNHAVDAVLGGVIEFSAAGFGADVALATLNMTDYDPLLLDPFDATAGWRGLSPSDDLPWLVTGTVHASPTSFEATIPLEALFGAPTGETRELGFVVRITNGTGDYTANQSLPEGVSGDNNENSSDTVAFPLTY